MSFGFGDFYTVLQLANSAYKACRDGPGDYKEIAKEAVSLHSTLDQLSKDAGNVNSLLNRKGNARHAEFMKLVKNCEDTFSSLLEHVNKHSRLEERTGNRVVRLWHAYQVGSADLDTIRSKLTFHTSAMTLFLTSLEGSSIARMESTLNKIYKRLFRDDMTRAGNDRVSVASTSSMLSQLEDDDEAAWNQLKDELAADKFPMASIVANKEQIKSYMKYRLRATPPAGKHTAQPVNELPQLDAEKRSIRRCTHPRIEFELVVLRWCRQLLCLVCLRFEVFDHADRPRLSNGIARVAVREVRISDATNNDHAGVNVTIVRYAPRLICGPRSTTNRLLGKSERTNMMTVLLEHASSRTTSMSLPVWAIAETMGDGHEALVETDGNDASPNQCVLQWEMTHTGEAVTAPAGYIQVLISHKGMPFRLDLTTSVRPQPALDSPHTVPAKTTITYKLNPGDPSNDTRFSAEEMNDFLGPEVLHHTTEGYRPGHPETA